MSVLDLEVFEARGILMEYWFGLAVKIEREERNDHPILTLTLQNGRAYVVMPTGIALTTGWSTTRDLDLEIHNTQGGG
jgi:hypothetical protein